MKKLIKISDTHYIIADNSEIKEGDFYWTPIKRSIEQCVRKLLIIKNGQNDVKQFKITHSTQPELLGKGWMKSVLPLLLSEVEEAINGYNVEKMSEEYKNKKGSIPTTTLEDEIFKLGYKDGFKAHQELVKDKLFTVEQLNEAIAEAWNSCEDNENEETYVEVHKRITQSLLPKTEWEVEITNDKIKLL